MDRRATGVASRLERRVLGLAERADPAAMAVPVLAIICLLGILGVIYNSDLSSPFNMEHEGMPAADWSAAVLFGSGSLFVAARHLMPTHRRVPWLVLGVFLCYMSLDEFTVIHEHLELATGIDWQLLYVPIVLPGALAAVTVLRDLLTVTRVAGLVFVTGIVCWVVSQIFERLEWSSSTVPVRPGLIPPEEVLEMTGSALFGFAALVAVQKLLATRDSAAVV
jgi:hypothetical protein